MREENGNDLKKFCEPITFKDGTRQRVEARPQPRYTQALLVQAYLSKDRNSNDMLRQRGDGKN
eukprot:14794241-Heterocapsa_arctica.AAC.1